MRRRVLPVLAVALVAIPVAEAAAPGAWKGRATSMDRSFKYGKVTFTVKGDTMRKLTIEGVTVSSNCGGYKTIYVPKLTIKGKRFTGAYQPVKGVDDIISVHGTFSGGTAKGTFSEGPLCDGAGRFTARAG